MQFSSTQKRCSGEFQQPLRMKTTVLCHYNGRITKTIPTGLPLVGQTDTQTRTTLLCVAGLDARRVYNFKGYSPTNDLLNLHEVF